MATRRSCAAWAEWLSAVVASMMNGVERPGTPPTRQRSRSSVTLVTAEMASQASSSSRVVRRWTKTGMNVADTTPPSTMSWMMFGIVLARLYASAR